MGQQQLLLLVLGIVLVGVAVVIAIEDFDIKRKQARSDGEHVKMVDLASMAQAWKTRPALMGGGLSNNPADFSAFRVEVLGLKPTGTHGRIAYVDIPGAGCFKFFPSNSELRINALNETCTQGSWTKGIIIKGTRPEDISWDYR